MFPGEVGGWQKRRFAGGADPTDMREVPLCMGFNTGIPGAPISADRCLVPKRKSKRHSRGGVLREDGHNEDDTRVGRGTACARAVVRSRSCMAVNIN
jgi:hypothetical protein